VEEAAQKGFPIFPERAESGGGFLDRELRYAKRWLASLGIYDYEEPYDPYWGELVHFFASIRDGEPVIVGLEAGISNALAVIYANRAIDTGQKVFWPKKASELAASRPEPNADAAPRIARAFGKD